jgi:hypothetical protein
MSERAVFSRSSFRPVAGPLRALALAVVAAAVCGAASATPATAGSGQWTAIGPPRGNIDQLTGVWDAPGTVYAGSPDGDLWTSTDGGVTWSFVSRLNTNVGELSVDPGQAATVHWSTLTGVYRSADGGVTWQLVLAGLAFSSVVISPAAPQTAYVYLNSSIWRSDDAGLTWRQVGALPDSYSFGGFALAIDPTDPNTLYAGGQPGVAKSTDGGASWNPVFAFSDPPGDHEQIALFVAPSNPATLLLGVYPNPSGSITPIPRVWRSDDAGGT